MPKFKDPKFKDAKGFAQGMEGPRDYKSNINKSLSSLRGMLDNKDLYPNDDELTGSEENLQKINPGYSGEIETDSNLDRQKAYDALGAVRKRWASKMPQPQQQPIQQEPMSESDFAEIQQHIQRGQQPQMDQQNEQPVDMQQALEEKELRKKYLQDLVKRRMGK